VTGEELAAVAAALNAVMQQQSEEPQPQRMPAWRRAMRLEATENADVR
jgi:hypothetical protein